MASELLPDPEGPLQTVILCRGMSRSIPLRLCCRAPRTAMASRPSSDDIPFRLGRPRPAGRRPGAAGRGRADPAGVVGMESAAEGRPGMALRGRGHLLGRPLGDDPAAVLAPLGPEVEDPVGRLHHVEIVLDDDDRVPLVLEPVQDFQQLLDVVEVEPGGRLVEDVEGLAGALLDQLARQLDPLGLAAGERGRGLAELDVVEPHVVQGLEHRRDLGDVGEVLERLLDVHVEHVADALALEPDVQGLAVEPLPLADRAGHPDVGQEVHLQAVGAVPLAGLAPASRDVEAEPARLVAPGAGLGELRVEVADQVQQLDVRGRVRARRAADRRLVDVDDLVEVVHPLDPVVGPGRAVRAVQVAGQDLAEDVADQRALARAAHPRHADEETQREGDVDVLEVVVAGAPDGQGPAVRGLAFLGDGDRGLAGEVGPGQALARLRQLSRASPGRRSRPP